MITLVDERLRVEAERFRLRFACEECAHFVPDQASCEHGYPPGPRREPALDARHTLVFCKEFELV